MTEEVLTDAIDEAMEDDEGEEEAVVAQVLEEIGIEITHDLGKVGNANIEAKAAPQQAAPVGVQQEDDLEERLNALKR